MYADAGGDAEVGIGVYDNVGADTHVDAEGNVDVDQC